MRIEVSNPRRRPGNVTEIRAVVNGGRVYANAHIITPEDESFREHIERGMWADLMREIYEKEYKT